MKNLRLRTKVARVLRGTSRGVTLIEVLIALALFTIIAIVFLGGLTVAARAVFIGDQRTTAESLARAQMEYVKSQAYSPAEWDYEITATSRTRTYHEEPDKRPTWWSDVPEDIPPELDAMYHAYAVRVDAEPIEDPDDPDSDLVGIQKIIVTVRHDDRVVFTLEGYNMDR
jgi:prepilin-type N-terminal cleavage/methylation domain-containing protein